MIDPRDYLTWLQFKQNVLKLLPLDASRQVQGDSIDANGMSVWLVGLIRQAVIDIQTHVMSMRVGHETVYYPEDFATEGHASRGVLPPQAQVRDCWMFKLPPHQVPLPQGTQVQVISGDCGFPQNPPDDSNSEGWFPDRQLIRETDQVINATLVGPLRFPMREFDWQRRFELVNRMVAVNDNHGRIAIDQYGYTFYVYPEVRDGFIFSLHWDGLKLDFKDVDFTPFNESVVGAVKEYVRGFVARDVEKDIAMYSSVFHPMTGSYVVARRNVYTEGLERGRIP